MRNALRVGLLLGVTYQAVVGATAWSGQEVEQTGGASCGGIPTSGDTGTAVSRDVYVDKLNQVHGTAGSSYDTCSCPAYTKDGKKEEQCGSRRKICVIDGQGARWEEDTSGTNPGRYGQCRPIRWGAWGQFGPWSECDPQGLQYRCKERVCLCNGHCKYKENACYNYFKQEKNKYGVDPKRSPDDSLPVSAGNSYCGLKGNNVAVGQTATAKCQMQASSGYGADLNKQWWCESRKKQCFCQEECISSSCGGCGDGNQKWPMTPAGATASLPCIFGTNGCGSGGRTRKCTGGCDNCYWEAEVNTCTPIGWLDAPPLEACPEKQCSPDKNGNVVQDVIRESWGKCSDPDQSKCERCGERPHKRQVCKVAKVCECIEPLERDCPDGECPLGGTPGFAPAPVPEPYVPPQIEAAAPCPCPQNNCDTGDCGCPCANNDQQYETYDEQPSTPSCGTECQKAAEANKKIIEKNAARLKKIEERTSKREAKGGSLFGNLFKGVEGIFVKNKKRRRKREGRRKRKTKR